MLLFIVVLLVFAVCIIMIKPNKTIALPNTKCKVVSSNRNQSNMETKSRNLTPSVPPDSNAVLVFARLFTHSM